MLEQANLLIRGQGAGWVLLDPDSRRPLGTARWRPVRWRFAPRWLARRALEVFETEDEPLLFIIKRLWGLLPKWEVCDADGNRIAVLRRNRILDVFGQPWAVVKRRQDALQLRGDDREFACAWTTDAGIQLEFAPELQGNPLAKMSLLATVLVQGERHGV
jgi:hypothetical protein